MLRIVLGYRSEHRESDPTVIYAGHDADAAQRAVDSSDARFLRVEIGDFPSARRARKSCDAGGNGPAPAPAPPTIEEGMAMLNRIDDLERALKFQSEKFDEERAGIQEEFKRQIEVAATEIRRWKDLVETAGKNVAVVPVAETGVDSPATGDSAPPSADAAPVLAPPPLVLGDEKPTDKKPGKR